MHAIFSLYIVMYINVYVTKRLESKFLPLLFQIKYINCKSNANTYLKYYLMLAAIAQRNCYIIILTKRYGNVCSNSLLSSLCHPPFPLTIWKWPPYNICDNIPFSQISGSNDNKSIKSC